jgi:TolB-like protein
VQAGDRISAAAAMTEEITAALAKVPDLRVVGRTSAFEFKGTNKDLRAIGQALSATHLIEGSVRKAGNRVRITAQLIKADDGTHIWAEDYDRELNDVFAIQEDIARAITASLHMTLALKPGENLVNNRKIDPEAYTEYLRIRASVISTGTAAARQKARSELEKLIAREPEFAPARAYLATVRFAMVNDIWPTMWTRPAEQSRAMVDDILRQTEREARVALRLDPGQADAYLALGLIERSRGHWAAAGDLGKKAALLDPNNPVILTNAASFAMQTGHVQESAEFMRQALALDLLSPNRSGAVMAGGIDFARADFRWQPRARTEDGAVQEIRARDWACGLLKGARLAGCMPSHHWRRFRVRVK